MTTDHEHVWVYEYTYADWWDGDEEEVYRCTVEGCTERKKEYIGR